VKERAFGNRRLSRRLPLSLRGSLSRPLLFLFLYLRGRILPIGWWTSIQVEAGLAFSLFLAMMKPSPTIVVSQEENQAATSPLIVLSYFGSKGLIIQGIGSF
jgi:hypothetical protein